MLGGPQNTDRRLAELRIEGGCLAELGIGDLCLAEDYGIVPSGPKD